MLSISHLIRPRRLAAILPVATVLVATLQADVRAVGPDFSELYRQVRPSLVLVNVLDAEGCHARAGSGSGFIIAGTADDGTPRLEVVTADHVILGATRIEVVTSDGRTHRVRRVLAVGRGADLVRLELESALRDIQPLEVAPTIPAPGTRVAAFGNPPGLPNTITDGLAGEVVDQDGRRRLLLSNQVWPGLSGGPIVDLKGRVVAVVLGVYNDGPTFAALGHEISRLETNPWETLAEPFYFERRVLPGETLTGIAKRHSITVESLLWANQMDAPAPLREGALLTIPGAMHEVRPGNTLSGIAANFSVSLDELLEVNALERDAVIHPGQRLHLPRLSRIVYRVRRGESLTSIARALDTTVGTLVERNGLKSTVIHPGQRLMLFCDDRSEFRFGACTEGDGRCDLSAAIANELCVRQCQECVSSRVFREYGARGDRGKPGESTDSQPCDSSAILPDPALRIPMRRATFTNIDIPGPSILGSTVHVSNVEAISNGAGSSAD